MWALERLVSKGGGRTGLTLASRARRALPASRGGAGAAWSSFAVTCCLLIVAGCSQPELDDAYRNYIKRLGNTLDVTARGIATVPGPRYPRTGKLQLPIPGSDLDTLEFLSLTGCAVQVTIGKRNSSLGRMAPPSQRLLLELEYLRLAPECISHLRADGKRELAQQLDTAWHAKRAQLPALIFNATLGSAEFRALWRKDHVAGDFPAVQSSQVVTALEAVTVTAQRWLSGDFEADGDAFELLLSDIAGGDAGQVLQALARQHAWLMQANAMLAERRERGPLCAPGIRHEAATILPNVAQKFFVGEIQPHAAAMDRRVYALLPPLKSLEDALAEALAGAQAEAHAEWLPPLYTRWQTQRDSLLEEARAAPAAHVAALQETLAGCDISPQV